MEFEELCLDDKKEVSKFKDYLSQRKKKIDNKCQRTVCKNAHDNYVHIHRKQKYCKECVKRINKACGENLFEKKEVV